LIRPDFRNGLAEAKARLEDETSSMPNAMPNTENTLEEQLFFCS